MKLRWTAIALLGFVSVAHAAPKREHHRRHRPKITAEGTPPPEHAAEAAPVVAPAPPPVEPATAPAPAAQPVKPPANPPGVNVTTKLDKSSLSVGDVAKLQVVVDAPSSIEPALPEQAFGGLELLDRRLTTVPTGDRTLTTFELDLLALNAGDANIPSLQLKLVGQNGELSEAHTDAQSLRVTSLLANEPNAEPKGLSKPLSVMQDDYTVAWVGAGLLAIALIAAATLLISRWVKRRPKPVVPPPPPRPPWELAVERLDALAATREQLFAEEKGEVFVDGVSDALREYLGRRYGFDGLERTTSELMQTLGKLRPHALQLPELSSLLDECDLVKFARAAPDAEQSRTLWEGALRIVKSTTPTGTSLPPLPLPPELSK